MSTKFSDFSGQEKLSKKHLITLFGGTTTNEGSDNTDGNDDHDGPKVLKPVRPTSPTGGGN